MLKEIREHGFEYAELSHGIRITLVPGILKALEEGVIKISSCHNFCPLPPGIIYPAPNLFQPSAKGTEEHEQWVRYTKRSIDFAAQVKAPVLVCHLGSVSFFWFNPVRKVRHYMRNNARPHYRDDKTYQKLRDDALAKLRKRMPVFWDNVKKSIGLVLEHASNRGVKLAFENREKFDELPLDDDFGSLFESLPADAPVGYWHDAGHADLKEHMGLLSHLQHLEKNAPRLLGFHLHDVNNHNQDHQAIGSGHIDFRAISKFWKPTHRFILELSPRLSPDEVDSSKRVIEGLLAGI